MRLCIRAGLPYGLAAYAYTQDAKRIMLLATPSRPACWA